MSTRASSSTFATTLAATLRPAGGGGLSRMSRARLLPLLELAICAGLIAAGPAAAAGAGAAAPAPAPVTVALGPPVAAPLTPFFAGTGFTPSKYLLSEQGRLNMLMASGSGYRFMRVHCMLDLVDIGAPSHSTGQRAYNWTKLDYSLDVLVDAGLTPFINLDGNPTGALHLLFQSHDFLYPAKLSHWRDLMEELGHHLVQRYTAPAVRKWVFEHWNEPMTIDKFCADGKSTPAFGSYDSMFAYFDACEAGLHAADAGLQLGGPTTHSSVVAGSEHDPVGPFLDHCEKGQNAITNKTGTRLDFISIHRKGSDRRVQGGGNSSNILAMERGFFALIREQHSKYASLPFFNDEGDPLSGWALQKRFRAELIYPAFMVAAITEHVNAASKEENMTIDGIPYGLISNDNSFIGGWQQRTLLTTFHADDCVANHSTACLGDPYQVIKKPDLTVMTLLSRLPDLHRIPLQMSGVPLSVKLSGMASTGSSCTSVMLSRSDNTAPTVDGPLDVTLDFGQLDRGVAANLTIAYWQLDGTHGNPHAAWTAAGSPQWPTSPQMMAMEGAQEPVLVSSEPYVSGAGFKVAMPLPAVTLVQLCAQPTVGPAAPTQLTVLPIQGGNASVLHWALPDEGKAVLQTYIVEESVDGEAFTQLASQNLIASAWLYRHERSRGKKRCYRVSAKNYWGDVSAPTEPACTTFTFDGAWHSPPKNRALLKSDDDVPRPNVLFVVYDDLRPQLGAYGHEQMSTPNFDSLAAESLVFNRAYTNYPYCAPSRNSFMSGRMPDHAQDWNFLDSFRQKDVHSTNPTPNVGAEWVALPQFFRQQGYWTVGSGKLYHPNLPVDNDNPKSWSENLTDFGGNSGCTCPNVPSATHPHAPMFCALPENTTCPDVIITDTVVGQLRRWDSTPSLKAQPFFVGFGIHKVRTITLQCYCTCIL